MITLSKKNFKKEVLDSNSGMYYLVDFYADWCNPCKQLTPILNKINKRKDVKVGKIDVEMNPELVARYNIQNLPTVLIFQNGNVKNQCVGNISEQKLSRKLA